MTSRPISPPPVTGDGPDHLPAYVSNGVIGLRVLGLPTRPGVAMLNGCAGTHPVLGIEQSPQAPYPLAGDVGVGSVRLSQFPERATFGRQEYDFACGELHTSFRVQLDGVELDVSVVTFASRSHPALVLQEVAVVPSRACRLMLSAVVATTDVPGTCVNRTVDIPSSDGEAADGSLRFEPPGSLSASGTAYATELVGSSGFERSKASWAGGGNLETTYRVDAVAGQRYGLRQIAAMVPGSGHELPDHEAVRLLTAARGLGFDELRRRNADLWKELWLGRLVLHGASDRWQGMADAAHFYLQSSVHPSSPASTSIFGLSQWPGYHYYYGHIMWDIEAFSVPPLLLTQPDAAEALLGFRRRTRDAAADNALLNGRRGLQFPWEAGPTDGREAAPLGAAGPSYEDHVSLVVANAFAQHAQASGSIAVAAEQVWPVVSGVAEWIVSRSVRTRRGYEIPRTLGVAERPEPADNNAFVNVGAITVLRQAAQLACRLGRSAPVEWCAIADDLVLPIDNGVLLDHDGFDPDEEKAATPSAAAALTLFGSPVGADVASATRRYWLARADEYVGSPMLSSLLGAWAAQEGDRARSIELFEDGYAAFCSPRFGNVHEYRPDVFPDEPLAGPFYANLSGFLLACIFGLGRLRFGDGEPSTWCDDGPIVMPQGWDGIEVERVWAHGRRHRLVVEHGGQRARLEPHDG